MSRRSRQSSPRPWIPLERGRYANLSPKGRDPGLHIAESSRPRHIPRLMGRSRSDFPWLSSVVGTWGALQFSRRPRLFFSFLFEQFHRRISGQSNAMCRLEFLTSMRAFDTPRALWASLLRDTVTYNTQQKIFPERLMLCLSIQQTETMIRLWTMPAAFPRHTLRPGVEITSPSPLARPVNQIDLRRWNVVDLVAQTARAIWRIGLPSRERSGQHARLSSLSPPWITTLDVHLRTWVGRTCSDARRSQLSSRASKSPAGLGGTCKEPRLPGSGKIAAKKKKATPRTLRFPRRHAR